MRILSRYISALIVATLTACGGGGSSPTLPSQPGSSDSAQSVPRRVVDSDGSVRTVLYTKDVELSGRVNAGTDPGRQTLSTNPYNLYYHGGPIQTAPKIYVVYWGNWTATGDPRGVRSYFNKYIAGIGGSRWLSTVTQYTQTGGHRVGNSAGSYIASTQSWNDTSTIPSLTNAATYETLLVNEAIKAASHFGNHTVNASYIIALPHRVAVSQFAGSCGAGCNPMQAYCAWHSYAVTSSGRIAYTNLPYQPDANYSCGQGFVNYPGYNDGVSIVGGHEQAETETDPQENAWYDSGGSEIGDKCAWTNLQNIPFSTGVFPSQPLWSNAIAGCVQ